MQTVASIHIDNATPIKIDTYTGGTIAVSFGEAGSRSTLFASAAKLKQLQADIAAYLEERADG